MDLTIFEGTSIIIGHRNNHFQSLCFFNGNGPVERCSPTKISKKLSENVDISITSSKCISSGTVPTDSLKQYPSSCSTKLKRKSERLDDILSTFLGPCGNQKKDEIKKMECVSSKPCSSAVTKRPNVKNFTAESKLQKDCHDNGISYLPFMSVECQMDLKNRKTSMQSLIRKKKNTYRQHILCEKRLQEKCAQNGVKYIPAEFGESSTDIRKRRNMIKLSLKKVLGKERKKNGKSMKNHSKGNNSTKQVNKSMDNPQPNEPVPLNESIEPF